MSKKVITHTIETVVEDWEFCNFRDSITGGIAKTNRCGYCRYAPKRYMCGMFDKLLKNRKESVNVVFKCEECIREGEKH